MKLGRKGRGGGRGAEKDKKVRRIERSDEPGQYALSLDLSLALALSVLFPTFLPFVASWEKASKRRKGRGRKVQGAKRAKRGREGTSRTACPAGSTKEKIGGVISGGLGAVAFIHS